MPSSAASSRGGFGDRERSGGFGDRERGGGFADKERSGGFGDRYAERRSGFAEGDPSRADDADRCQLPLCFLYASSFIQASMALLRTYKPQRLDCGAHT